jgi:hypothetical protein
MSNGRNKYQSRENRAAVREILMREWDPIGVKDVPRAEGEYDGYVGEVYILLSDKNVSEEDIAAHLINKATTHMALLTSPELIERSHRAAARLVGLRPTLQLH